VIAMLGRRFRPQLDRDGGLRTITRRRLAAAFHRRWSKPISWRGAKSAPSRILDTQAQALARLFDGRTDRYEGFLMTW
jgi:hypothetical protein